MSVVHPYQPMVIKPEATEAQVQAMHERLANRVRGSGGVPEEPNGAQSPPSSTASASPNSVVGESPKEKSVPIWNRPTTKVDTAVKTNCGRYCCCKITLDGKPYYELWRLLPERKLLQTRLDSFLQAQLLAEQDAAQ